jgi:hypothetical protein
MLIKVYQELLDHQYKWNPRVSRDFKESKDGQDRRDY